MNNLKELNEIPPVMYMRAEWARQTMINHPELVHIDKEDLMAWVYHEEDELWYSINGNYSKNSPEQKMKKREESRQYYVNMEKEADERFKQTLYWSKVRQAVLERDKNTCQFCGKQAPTRFHIHHVEKVKEKGLDFMDMLITVCPKCHRAVDKKYYDPPWIE